MYLDMYMTFFTSPSTTHAGCTDGSPLPYRSSMVIVGIAHIIDGRPALSYSTVFAPPVMFSIASLRSSRSLGHTLPVRRSAAYAAQSRFGALSAASRSFMMLRAVSFTLSFIYLPPHLIKSNAVRITPLKRDVKRAQGDYLCAIAV